MLYFDGLFGLLLLVLWLFCIFDVITTDATRCRNLPKLAWLAIVLILPDVGSIAWLVAGHPWQPAPAGRRTGSGRPTTPDDDEAFLQALRERAQQQRRDHQARTERERQEPDQTDG